MGAKFREMEGDGRGCVESELGLAGVVAGWFAVARCGREKKVVQARSLTEF